MSTQETIPDKAINFGQYLRAGRESKKLSIQDVADQLRLPISMIHYIESDQWCESELQKRVYIQGYMRSYARLLDIADSLVDDAFQACGWRAVDQVTVSHQPVMIPYDLSLSRHVMKIVSYSAILVVVSMVLLWRCSYRRTDLLTIPHLRANNTTPSSITPRITGVLEKHDHIMDADEVNE